MRDGYRAPGTATRIAQSSPSGLGLTRKGFQVREGVRSETSHSRPRQDCNPSFWQEWQDFQLEFSSPTPPPRRHSGADKAAPADITMQGVLDINRCTPGLICAGQWPVGHHRSRQIAGNLITASTQRVCTGPGNGASGALKPQLVLKGILLEFIARPTRTCTKSQRFAQGGISLRGKPQGPASPALDRHGPGTKWGPASQLTLRSRGAGRG
jgi:hypothetical protein